MNTDELRNLDSEKLQSQLKEHYEELFNLRFQQVMGKLTASGRRQFKKMAVRMIQNRKIRKKKNHLKKLRLKEHPLHHQMIKNRKKALNRLKLQKRHQRHHNP